MNAVKSAARLPILRQAFQLALMVRYQGPIYVGTSILRKPAASGVYGETWASGPSDLDIDLSGTGQMDAVHSVNCESVASGAVHCCVPAEDGVR